MPGVIVEHHVGPSGHWKHWGPRHHRHHKHHWHHKHHKHHALARALIDRHARELAAVIVEPVLGSMGMIPATTEFLGALREATARHGIVLVFDEVITLRVSHGGAQQIHGVTPDLTSLGKIIGGGLPIGAFGGREDLMRMFHPDQPAPVMHASTFSGNPLSMAAGFAAMDALDPQATSSLNALGERLRAGIGAAFERHGIRGQATGLARSLILPLSTAPLAGSLRRDLRSRDPDWREVRQR